MSPSLSPLCPAQHAATADRMGAPSQCCATDPSQRRYAAPWHRLQTPRGRSRRPPCSSASAPGQPRQRRWQRHERWPRSRIPTPPETWHHSPMGLAQPPTSCSCERVTSTIKAVATPPSPRSPASSPVPTGLVRASLACGELLGAPPTERKNRRRPPTRRRHGALAEAEVGTLRTRQGHRHSATIAGPTRRRCAIYTRKSFEEGLEQSFNFLDAQREAYEAYITSQRHEG